MRSILFAAALLAAAPAAHAATVLEDDFSSYGVSSLLNAPDGLFLGVWETVAGTGTVDYIRGADFGNICRGNVACIDLDGSTSNAGVFQTVESFAPGEYKLSFEIFGSSRGDTNEVTVSLGGLNLVQSITSAGDWIVTEILATIGAGGSKLSFSNFGGDNLGAILNSVKLVKVENGGGGPAPIPLPAAAPLLLGGIGLIGLAGWRRRRDG
jgi:hypothetical protein